MHKQTEKIHLLKLHRIFTRLRDDALVFDTYKPSNENAKLNVIYRGTLA